MYFNCRDCSDHRWHLERLIFDDYRYYSNCSNRLITATIIAYSHLLLQPPKTFLSYYTQSGPQSCHFEHAVVKSEPRLFHLQNQTASLDKKLKLYISESRKSVYSPLTLYNCGAVYMGGQLARRAGY